jgi:hypothetical protein
MQGRKFFALAPKNNDALNDALNEALQGERFFAPTKARVLSVASKSNGLSG